MSSTRFFGIAALAAALVFPAAAFAQTAPPAPGAPPASGAPGAHRHGRHGGGMMRMMRNLNLSAAQQQQIKTLMQQSRQQNRNVTDPAARKANRERLHQQIEAVLTPAQRTQLQAEMQRRRGAHRGPQGSPAPVPVH